jgi:hypothetical protein
MAFPLDVFFAASKDPAVIMGEYARLTGLPEMPALWTLGYQQSHRTLASREEILQEAKTFREKKLPCDTMIYLGTGFCPSGWNTNNTEFTFNQKVMPDPKVMFEPPGSFQSGAARGISDRERGWRTGHSRNDRQHEGPVRCEGTRREARAAHFLLLGYAPSGAQHGRRRVVAG